MSELSVVVPSRNPHSLFLQKVQFLALNHPTWQIIVIDDNSDIPLERHFPRFPNLLIQRNDISLGAGACRNLGIAKLSKPFTLFIDDDDEINWKVVRSIMATMEKDPFIDVSFCLYDRLVNGTYQAALDRDRKIFNEALEGDHEGVVSIGGHEMLLAFTNYPWNKVYRTSFIQSTGLRFSETPVQNDILAHWLTLLRANRILLSDCLICTRVEYDMADRIGNIADARCVKAFQALRETYQVLRLEGTIKAKTVFLRFYLDLMQWLSSKCSVDVRRIIFREHNEFVDLLRADGILDLAQPSIRQWECWDLPIMGDRADISRFLSQVGSEDGSEISLVLAEMSRLKHLAADLRADNGALRAQVDGLSLELEEARSSLHDLAATNHSLNQTLSRKIVRLAVRAGDICYALLRRKLLP